MSDEINPEAICGNRSAPSASITDRDFTYTKPIMDDVSHQYRSVSDGKVQSTCAETKENSASHSAPMECSQCGHGMNLRAYFYRRKNGAIEGRIRCTICDTLHSRISRKHPLLIDRTPPGETQRRMFID